MAMTKHEWKIAAALLILITAVLYMRYQWIDHTTTAQWGYVNSGALNPYYGVNRPYGYRLLMSVVLSIVGVVPKPGEITVPLSFAVLLCICFYGCLRGLNFDWRLASVGALLLCCSNGMIDLLRDFGINNADTSSHILLLAAMWAMAAGRDSLFSAFTFLGVFNREWALVMVPTWYLYHYGFLITKVSIIRLVRIAAPSLAVYFLVRYVYYPNTALGVMAADLQAILPPTEAPTWNYYLFEMQNSSMAIFFNRVFSKPFYEFGMIGLTPSAIAGLFYISNQWKRAIAFYVSLCVLQLYFTTDVWRLAFYLFPVMIGLYLRWIRVVERMANRKIAMVIGLFSATAFLLAQGSLMTVSLNSVVVLGFYWMSGRGLPNK